MFVYKERPQHRSIQIFNIFNENALTNVTVLFLFYVIIKNNYLNFRFWNNRVYIIFKNNII
jgi:hypothetical protein